MVTQSGDPNTKSKPTYKNYCHKNNHGVSNCYQKQRDEEYQRLKKGIKNSSTIFVQYFRSKPSNSQENWNENKNYSYQNDRYRNYDRCRSNQ